MRALVLPLVASALLVAGPAPAHDEGSAPTEAEALALSQAAIGRVVGSVTFRDGAGDVFTLDELRGRPLVVSLVYTSCAHTCPLVTRRLASAIAAAQDALGPGRFAVLTVGFDVGVDTPARMEAYGREQGVDLPDWRFVALDGADAHGFLDDLGFAATPIAGGFDHLAQTTILDGEGRVLRQVYGDGFEPPEVVDPLLDAVLGRATGKPILDALVDRVTLFCTVYDPATNAYRFDYALFVELAAGGTSLLAVAIFLWREWCRRARATAT
jgi:protein SCO1/2